MTGYKDWQRGQQQTSDLIVSEVYTVPSNGGTVLTTAQYTSTWSGIVLSVTPSASQYVSIEVIWLSNTTPRATIATYQLIVYGTDQQGFVFPALGNWFQLEFQTAAGAASVNVQTYVSGTNAQTAPVPQLFTSMPLLQIDESVAGNTSTTIGPSLTYAGRATFSVYSSTGAAYYAKLAYYDLATAGYKNMLQIYGVASSGGPQCMAISLPATPLELTVGNSSSTAQGLTASLVAG